MVTVMTLNRKPFSEQIKLLIKEYGVGKLATKIGTSDTMLRNWKSGKSEPGLKNLLAISNATGRSVEWLATGSEPCDAGDVVREDASEYLVHNGEQDLSYDDKMRRVGDMLKGSRQLYDSAVKLANYEPEPAVGENIKTIIFDSFAQEKVDVKTVTRLLEALRDSQSK